jgi:hypothetical protein
VVRVPVNKQRLQKLFHNDVRSKEETRDAILQSLCARDFGLNGRDISNVRLEVDRGTFRLHDNDAQSVKLMVCLCACLRRAALIALRCSDISLCGPRVAGQRCGLKATE